MTVAPASTVARLSNSASVLQYSKFPNKPSSSGSQMQMVVSVLSMGSFSKARKLSAWRSYKGAG